MSPEQGSTTANSPGQPVVCVITSEGDTARAERLARLLVERGLAGCVSLLPQTSFYGWEGQLERSAEVQLLIKTTPCRLEALHQAVLESHSYDTPMWVQWQGLADQGYGAWLAQVTADPDAPPPTGAGSPGSGAPAG